MESLYVGARPTTLFFLAEALLEYEQQFGLWRFHHVPGCSRLCEWLRVKAADCMA